MAALGTGNSGPVLGRLAVLHRRNRRGASSDDRHEHADRRRQLGGLLLQRGRDPVPRVLRTRGGSPGGAVLRHSGSDRHAHPLRSAAGTPCARANLRGDPAADRPPGEDGARRS